ALLSLPRRIHQTELVGRRHEGHERYYEQLDIDSWVVELGERLAAGEPDAIEDALALLERDPYFFRSGYVRERVAGRLALADAARGHWLSPSVARLAAYVWSGGWEAELRGLIPYHGPDRAAAKRLLDVADRRRSRRPDP